MTSHFVEDAELRAVRQTCVWSCDVLGEVLHSNASGISTRMLSSAITLRALVRSGDLADLDQLDRRCMIELLSKDYWATDVPDVSTDLLRAQCTRESITFPPHGLKSCQNMMPSCCWHCIFLQRRQKTPHQCSQRPSLFLLTKQSVLDQTLAYAGVSTKTWIRQPH